MIELARHQYSSAAQLFACTRYGALAAGTLYGSHPGRVFVDDPIHPAAGLVCTRAGIGYYFLAGQPSPRFLDALRAAFSTDFIPAQEAALQNPEVLLFFDPPGLQPALFDCFAACRPVRIQKKRFTLPPETLQRLLADEPALPPGMRAAAYSQDLFERYPSLAEEPALFYGSTAAFLQHSLGVCVLDGETPACTCHAVFTAVGEAEISIVTAPEYRRRGLAYLAARLMIAECARRGLAPIWGCWPENEPSVALAARLGFCAEADQPVCLWVNRDEWNPAPEAGS